MSERKVVNKYYPPDFDPTKLKIIDKKTNRKICNVRMMLSMTLKCYTCNQYMYIGTKFNMKVETVFDEDYLGIKIHRFYFKCSNCSKKVRIKKIDFLPKPKGSFRNDKVENQLLNFASNVL